MQKKEKKVKKKKNITLELVEGYKTSGWQKFYMFLKSCCDILIGLLSVIIFSPFFLVIAICIKIDSKGPVFFKQKRVGKNNKVFTCLKFRSMSTKAPAYEVPTKLKSENYITKMGAFLRRTSIDELPQLICLLTGKMSLIGYRPCQQQEQDLNEVRNQYGAYQTKPGITGFAQVNGRDILAAMPRLKAKYDAYYVQNLSLWLDIKIFFKTILNIFTGKDVVEGEEAVERAKEMEQSFVIVETKKEEQLEIETQFNEKQAEEQKETEKLE